MFAGGSALNDKNIGDSKLLTIIIIEPEADIKQEITFFRFAGFQTGKATICR
jgi:hypothetical protein